MDIFVHMGQQPLFLLISAIIVLLITDWKPAVGFGAFVVWALWMYVSRNKKQSNSNSKK